MAGYFEPTGPAGPGGGGAAVALDKVEISILRSLAVQLLELIGPGPGERAGEAGDPLDALFAEGPSKPPRDPALARLFPDAYGEPGQEQDEETERLSAEFRRFTEHDLRAGKREALMTMVRGLDALTPDIAPEGEEPGGAVLTLDSDESQQWVRALNDLRLAIAARLGIADEEDSERLFSLPDGDPDKPVAFAYLWLGALQDSLLATLLP